MALALDSRLLLAALALAMRLATMLALLPIMDRRSVPLLWRLAVAVPLAWALAPAVLHEMPPTVDMLRWELLVLEGLNSLLVGAVLGFAVSLVVNAVRFAGAIIGMQVGFAIVNAYDPHTGSQISIIAQFYFLLATLLFFALDIHLVMVRVLVASFQVLPPFAACDTTFGALEIVRAHGRIFSLGLQVAAPVALLLLLVSATMGVIVKTAPQIHVLVVGFPVKIAVGLMAIGSSLVFFRSIVERAFVESSDLVLRIVEGMG